MNASYCLSYLVIGDVWKPHTAIYVAFGFGFTPACKTLLQPCSRLRGRDQEEGSRKQNDALAADHVFHGGRGSPLLPAPCFNSRCLHTEGRYTDAAENLKKSFDQRVSALHGIPIGVPIR